MEATKHEELMAQQDGTQHITNEGGNVTSEQVVEEDEGISIDEALKMLVLQNGDTRSQAQLVAAVSAAISAAGGMKHVTISVEDAMKVLSPKRGRSENGDMAEDASTVAAVSDGIGTGLKAIMVKDGEDTVMELEEKTMEQNAEVSDTLQILKAWGQPFSKDELIDLKESTAEVWEYISGLSQQQAKVVYEDWTERETIKGELAEMLGAPFAQFDATVSAQKIQHVKEMLTTYISALSADYAKQVLAVWVTMGLIKPVELDQLDATTAVLEIRGEDTISKQLLLEALSEKLMTYIASLPKDEGQQVLDTWIALGVWENNTTLQLLRDTLVRMTLHKSALTRLAVQAGNRGAFENFPKLPTELQDKIWAYASSRILHIRPHLYNLQFSFVTPASLPLSGDEPTLDASLRICLDTSKLVDCPPTNISLVCQQAATAVAREHTAWILTNNLNPRVYASEKHHNKQTPAPSKTIPHPFMYKRLPINTAHDILFLKLSDNKHSDKLTFAKRNLPFPSAAKPYVLKKFSEGVQCVAIGFTMGWFLTQYKFRDILRLAPHFVGLKKLLVIIGPHRMRDGFRSTTQLEDVASFDAAGDLTVSIAEDRGKLKKWTAALKRLELKLADFKYEHKTWVAPQIEVKRFRRVME